MYMHIYIRIRVHANQTPQMADLKILDGPPFSSFLHILLSRVLLGSRQLLLKDDSEVGKALMKHVHHYGQNSCCVLEHMFQVIPSPENIS